MEQEEEGKENIHENLYKEGLPLLIFAINALCTWCFPGGGNKQISLASPWEDTLIINIRCICFPKRTAVQDLSANMLGENESLTFPSLCNEEDTLFSFSVPYMNFQLNNSEKKTQIASKMRSKVKIMLFPKIGVRN